jgi:2',3'-cyclic-nucleotide 2'-phosphodiesterase (5'-nucleotidase family)
VNDPLPPALDGTALRVLSTSDLGATTVPLRTTYGEGGSCAGVVALLERERERQPTIWLDLGDLVVGTPAYPLLGERPWDDMADLPIAAAAVGNHEFDDGLDALLAVAPRLSFPLLCANVDIGLPGSTLIETEAGPVGVIGLTHPASDRFSEAPPIADWHDRVGVLARELRRDGARWVVALLHDGVEWWPSQAADGAPIATRSDRLDAVARPWAGQVDVILCGHNFGSWVGTLGGTPAAEPHLFAASLSVVDLTPDPVVRGVYQVPPVRPASATAATAAVDAAAERIVGELPEAWVTRTGAARYLPDLIAEGFRTATGADAGFAMPGFHAIQAPLDGVIASLGPGPVTELDVLRPIAALDYDPVVVELRAGELERAVKSYWATADPRNAAADRLWWNWCRMPAGTSFGSASPQTVAVIPGVVAHLCEWLGRDLAAEPAGVSARDAVIGALG